MVTLGYRGSKIVICYTFLQQCMFLGCLINVNILMNDEQGDLDASGVYISIYYSEDEEETIDNLTGDNCALAQKLL